MTMFYQIVTILIAAVATLLTRFLPFIIFKGKKIPKALDYLGFALPASVFGMILVYALKDTVVLSYPFAIPEVLGLLVTTVVYLCERETLLCMALGAVVYMFLGEVVL